MSANPAMPLRFARSVIERPAKIVKWRVTAHDRKRPGILPPGDKKGLKRLDNKKIRMYRYGERACVSNVIILTWEERR